LTLLSLYLTSVIISFVLMVLMNKLHDGYITLSDLSMDVIWSLVPLFNACLVVVMFGFLLRKTGTASRVSDWWDRVSQKKVF
jgi:uncharacterized membrane protein